MVIRLQCRVTAANKELYEQLENMPDKYRAKRLVELASMMSIMLGAGGLNPFSAGSVKATAADAERQERKRKTSASSARTPPQLQEGEATNHVVSHSDPALHSEEKDAGELTSEVNQDDKPDERAAPKPSTSPSKTMPNFLKGTMQLGD